jgi:hypothetical protein
MPQEKKSDETLALLDRFAMAALTGIYAARRDTAQGGAGGHNPAEAALMAYAATQAMLNERIKHAYTLSQIMHGPGRHYPIQKSLLTTRLHLRRRHN